MLNLWSIAKALKERFIMKRQYWMFWENSFPYDFTDSQEMVLISTNWNMCYTTPFSSLARRSTAANEGDYFWIFLHIVYAWQCKTNYTAWATMEHLSVTCSCSKVITSFEGNNTIPLFVIRTPNIRNPDSCFLRFQVMLLHFCKH